MQNDKPLNIYFISKSWHDGEDNYIVFSAIVRAENEKEALQLMNEDFKGDEELFDGADLNIEMLGWATGSDMCKKGLISVELPQ